MAINVLFIVKLYDYVLRQSKVMKITLFLIFIMLSGNALALDEKVVLKNVKKLGKELKKELQAGMKKSPSEALQICNIKAPKIEEKYKSEDLKIGRVSLKNRNPSNRPKEWMKQYIEKFHAQKNTKSYMFVSIDNKRKGLLKPIITMPNCLKCHGSNIDKSLEGEILKLYPNDKARGYKVGEIRGFFWAEFNE